MKAFHSCYFRSARLDPTSCSLAATASGDFTARLWCASTGKELAELKHKHVVRAVDFAMVNEATTGAAIFYQSSLKILTCCFLLT
jgi:WD40 repeat protein